MAAAKDATPKLTFVNTISKDSWNLNITKFALGSEPYLHASWQLATDLTDVYSHIPKEYLKMFDLDESIDQPGYKFKENCDSIINFHDLNVVVEDLAKN